jgi:hypothetical protein
MIAIYSKKPQSNKQVSVVSPQLVSARKSSGSPGLRVRVPSGINKSHSLKSWAQNLQEPLVVVLPNQALLQ